MAIRPILFNTAMVRAIREDEKTQTRRIISPEEVAAVCDDTSIRGTAFAAIRRHIDAAPAVDAVEVVHGRWEYWAGGLPKCLVCGHEYIDYLECKDYCGNCGAKMDGDGNGLQIRFD